MTRMSNFELWNLNLAFAEIAKQLEDAIKNRDVIAIIDFFAANPGYQMSDFSRSAVIEIIASPALSTQVRNLALSKGFGRISASEVARSLIEQVAVYANFPSTATFLYAENLVEFIIDRNLDALSLDAAKTVFDLILGNRFKPTPLKKTNKQLLALHEAFPNVVTETYLAELRSGVTL